MRRPGATHGSLQALWRFAGLPSLVLGTLGLVGLAVSVAWALPHPAAPWALGWADRGLGAGHPGQVVANYEAVSAHHLSAEVRQMAHRRAAVVYATQLGRPALARRHLEAILAVTGEPTARAALMRQIGELLLDEGSPQGAAARFEGAAEAHPTAQDAGRQQLRAAQILSDAGRERRADVLYRRIARDHIALRGDAELGRAQNRLRKGQVERALTLFESALGHTYDPVVSEVARLGRTTCLERLGDLDSALAELEEVDMLPEEIVEERSWLLRSRREPMMGPSGM